MKCCASRLKIVPGLLVLVATFGAGYLAASYFGPPAPPAVTVSATGLHYIDLVEGQGVTPKLGQTIVVKYMGWLENGKELDMHALGSPAEFVLGPALIPGWNEALQTMKVGGKRRMTLPPHLAYGPIGRRPDIPGDATLIFEVELLGVK